MKVFGLVYRVVDNNTYNNRRKTHWWILRECVSMTPWKLHARLLWEILTPSLFSLDLPTSAAHPRTLVTGAAYLRTHTGSADIATETQFSVRTNATTRYRHFPKLGTVYTVSATIPWLPLNDRLPPRQRAHAGVHRRSVSSKSAASRNTQPSPTSRNFPYKQSRVTACATLA